MAAVRVGVVSSCFLWLLVDVLSKLTGFRGVDQNKIGYRSFGCGQAPTASSGLCCWVFVFISEDGVRDLKSFLAFHCTGMHICASTYQRMLRCMDAWGHGGMHMCIEDAGADRMDSRRCT